MENLITRIVSMETVWRVILFMEIHGKMSLKIVWGFHGENMANQITTQSPYQFSNKISLKSITIHTVSILSIKIISTVLWRRRNIFQV